MNNQQILKELIEKENNNFKWLTINVWGLSSGLVYSVVLGVIGTLIGYFIISNKDSGVAGGCSVIGLAIGILIAVGFCISTLVYLVKWIKSSGAVKEERERERERALMKNRPWKNNDVLAKNYVKFSKFLVFTIFKFA